MGSFKINSTFDLIERINAAQTPNELIAELGKAAETHCKGRIVSMLEGGYDLEALAKSVAVHVRTLMDLGS